MKNLLTLLVLVFATSIFVSSCGDDKATTTTAKTTETKKADELKKEEAPAATASADGEAIFNKACHVCHKTGVAGAAALEGDTFDKARWEEMAVKGLATLTKNASEGYNGKYGAMPAKGTCMDCSDDDLASAIKFMMGKAGVAVK